jgi:pimeloyl-ACP methyl ester carboxylesterase
MPGIYRRAVMASDHVHIAAYVYVPEHVQPNSPLVVLLPDLGTTHAFFDVEGHGLAQSLLARGYEVATLDWRGTGSSETPASPASLEDLLLLDLPALLHALPEQPRVLIGWGYGGAVAYSAAAGSFADQVRGVVALNGVVDLDVPNPLVWHLLDGPNEPIDLQRALSEPAPNRSQSLFHLLWLHGSELDEGLSDRLLAHALAPLSGKQVRELREWMQNGSVQLGGSYPALLKQLKVPVLAIDGLSDNWTHPEFAAAIRDYVPKERLTVYPVSRFEGFSEDSSHVGMVLGTCAERELTPLIVTFLVDVSRERPSSSEASR